MDLHRSKGIATIGRGGFPPPLGTSRRRQTPEARPSGQRFHRVPLLGLLESSPYDLGSATNRPVRLLVA